jgi:hypothetical protein
MITQVCAVAYEITFTKGISVVSEDCFNLSAESAAIFASGSACRSEKTE